MKLVFFPRIKLTLARFLPIFLLTSFLLSLTVFAQTAPPQPQLSLADILIGLRSKKVTLPERNALLTDAVKKRGITFTLTPEIEKELDSTGAGKELVEAIKQKIQKVAAPVVAAVKPTPAPVATPTPPPDSAFYRKRADDYSVKGSFDLALVDYNKAIELNPKDTSSYLSRAHVYSGKKDYKLAISDYDKTIELNPKDSAAYFNRGDSYEKMGDSQKAVADYQKAIELDANNEAAKNNLQRLQAEQARIVQEQKKKEEAAKAAETPVVPQSVELGQLNSYAVKLVTPIYPEIAQKMNVEGTVIVLISLDEEGKVVSAKATSGQKILRAACEEAAQKSKFKPALVNNQPVKATGFVTYNFKSK
ncbi:MAG: TonB family protein [Acidobacteriota bacterium]|nr:TonB family protein [Acidobacteriota bacterium]